MSNAKVRRGPKYKHVDPEQFEKLCEIQCTLREISGWFGISEDTLERWCLRHYKLKFADVFNQKRQKGIISIRRMQFQNALKGNTALLIWLGKQYLGQTEKIEEKSESLNKIIISEAEKDL